MATSLYKAQFALRTCDEHDKKELNYYCKTCKKTICTNCVKSEHNSHDWELISEYTKERRRQLPNECGDLQNKELMDLRRKIENYETKLEQNQKESDENESLLVSEQQRIINGINRMFKEKMKKSKEYSDDRQMILEKERDELTKKLGYLQMMTRSLKTDFSTFSDHDIIEMEEQLRNELETTVEFDPEKHVSCSVFLKGDRKMISSNLGILHTLSLDELASFSVSTSCPVIIEPLESGTAAWIGCNEEEPFNFISDSGKSLKTRSHSGIDLAVSSDGKFICLLTKSGVKILDDKEIVNNEIDLNPLQAMSIALTTEGDILVSLTDGGDLYDPDTNSKRLVGHMMKNGKVLHTYEFKDEGKERLFKCPWKVAENKNTDICVVNKSGSAMAEVIVLTREGKLKFCFQGTDPFDPVDVECDSKCRLLIADMASNSLIVLNSEGIHLALLHTFKEVLCAISMKNDKLWCAFLGGSIKVYNYK